MIARWSALILAGGAGRRFGGGKLLADLAGAPVIRRVADRVAGVGFAEVIAITGAEDAAIARALSGADLSITPAPDWAEGMAASLRTGIAALDPDSEGVCVFLGDMPLVPLELCPPLVAAAVQAGYAARPRCKGKPGHPVAFTRAAFGDLITLEGDRGATALLAAHGDAVAYVETADSGALLDIDTPSDLAAAVAAWKA
ncbi:nucleotidyltransferase family protein [Erythrobacter donghaensis]|uniref:nucleotidyltransferase family protein n=1 Tax=Erythrobacter donghaensis TaxID=267135 RepID=UPI000A3C44A7|nr:nucleotidyltransferase family protein [Erythrobacter donghaensis]